jgi:hypothetical protein
MTTDANFFGDLYDLQTGDYLGPATAEQRAASDAAAPIDMGAFRDAETGRVCFVDYPGCGT